MNTGTNPSATRLCGMPLPRQSGIRLANYSHFLTAKSKISPYDLYLFQKDVPMRLSATLCRAQQSFQRDRAASANLPNARMIAGAAAIAWEKEALSAEGREKRQRRMPLIADTIAANMRLSSQEFDRLCSENPDREFPSD